MAQEHIQRHRAGDDSGSEETTTGGFVHSTHAATDDLLDEIDGLLEDDAEEFVRSYVQKGGE